MLTSGKLHTITEGPKSDVIDQNHPLISKELNMGRDNHKMAATACQSLQRITMATSELELYPITLLRHLKHIQFQLNDTLTRRYIVHCHRDLFTTHCKSIRNIAGVKKADVLFLCWVYKHYTVNKRLAQVVLVQIVTRRPRTSEECTQIPGLRRFLARYTADMLRVDIDIVLKRLERYFRRLCFRNKQELHNTEELNSLAKTGRNQI